MKSKKVRKWRANGMVYRVNDQVFDYRNNQWVNLATLGEEPEVVDSRLNFYFADWSDFVPFDDRGMDFDNWFRDGPGPGKAKQEDPFEITPLGRQAIAEIENEAAEPKWEKVTLSPDGAGHTYRLRVPGGWIYRTVSYEWSDLVSGYTDNIAAQSTVFVPDPSLI